MEDPSLGGAVFTGPTRGHASSFFVNPAALGFSGQGWHLHMGGSGRLQSLWLDRDQLKSDGTLEPGASVSNHTFSPGGIIALYSSFRDNDGRFGISLFTPSLQRFPSGDPDIGYQSSGGQLLQSMLTLAGSLRLTGDLYVGIGISLGYSTLSLKFFRDGALSDGSSAITSMCGNAPCGYESEQYRETYEIDVGSQVPLQGLFALKNISASAGVAYKLPGGAWIALSYVALPGAFDTLSLDGNATVDRSPADGGGRELFNAEIGFSMAQMAFLGYRRELSDSLDLVTDIRWQDWSRHNQFDIRLLGNGTTPDVPEWMLRHRGFHDVWRFSAGVESDDREDKRFGARLRFETSAIDHTKTSAIQIGGANITLATGTEIRVAEHWVFNVGYEITWFPAKHVTNSAYSPRDQIACVDSQYEYSQCRTARDGRGLSTATGDYRGLQHAMVLSFRYDSL